MNVSIYLGRLDASEVMRYEVTIQKTPGKSVVLGITETLGNGQYFAINQETNTSVEKGLRDFGYSQLNIGSRSYFRKEIKLNS